MYIEKTEKITNKDLNNIEYFEINNKVTNLGKNPVKGGIPLRDNSMIKILIIIIIISLLKFTKFGKK